MLVLWFVASQHIVQTQTVTKDCISFVENCKPGYLKESVEVSKVNLTWILTAIVGSLALLIFLTILAMDGDNRISRRTLVIILLTWGLLALSLAVGSIIDAKHKEQNPKFLGGLSADEAACIQKLRNFLNDNFSGTNQPCVGDAANKPMTEYWND